MKFKVKIKGLCPLLMHRFDEAVLTDSSKRKVDNKLDEKGKKEAAKPYLYVDKKGKLVQPSSHIEGAMAKASTQFRFMGKKTYKEMVKGGVFAFPENIPHKIQKWEVDERAVVNPSTRGRKMCYRPRLESWELEFTLEVYDDRADAKVIKEILAYAGAYIGIGSYRPRFGRFEVVEFKAIK